MPVRASAVFQSVAVALVSAVVCGAAFASDHVPDWVKTASQQELPHYPATTAAVVLLDETTYTVASDGKAVEHVRRVVKILRPQGREDAIPVVAYDGDMKVQSMHAWSIDPAGHEYAIKDNEIRDIGMPGEGGQYYTDDRFKMIPNPPGLDVGGVVAYEYDLKQRPYIAETTWQFQSELPRVKQSFTLELPEGFTHTTTWAHHAPDKGIDMEHQRWRWEADNVPSINLDQVPMSPPGGALAGRMTLHYSRSAQTAPVEATWQGVGEWYQALAHDRLTATSDMAAKAAELVANKNDFYDRAEAVGEFAQQQIRYFVVEQGIGGQQPHPAADIFHGRYGDCKDKATVLSSLFSTVGIHSTYVMVDSERGVIDPDDPSILGNHMIAAIEIPKGYDSPKLRSVVTSQTGKRYLIFDPTSEKTPFGQLENNLQGSYGLLVEGKDSQVIELPVLDPGLNTVRRSAKFQLQADGSLKGDVTEKRFGDLAETRRTVFTQGDAKEQQSYMNHLLGRDFSSVTLSDVKVEDAAALNKDVTTTYTLDATHFATTVGGLLMVRPRVLGTYSLDVDHKKREIPIDLQETMRGTDEFDIALPDGYVVDELPDPVKLDLGFATYESSTELRGKSLHYSRTYTVRQVTLPADRYPALQKLASAINADEESRAILKKAQ